MAHELSIGDDGRVAMFYVDDMPWHKLGTKLKHPPTAEEAIRAAGLNWRVAKVPLFYHESIERVGIVPDVHAIIPTDGWGREKPRPVFGVVSDQYEPLQNSDAFEFFDPLISEGYATYETAGALGKGERIWVLAKLANPIDIKGDITEKFLLLSNSHNGKAAVQIKFTPIRVVCNNTLSMALAQNANYNVQHTRQLGKNMTRAQELFSRITCEYSDIETKFRKLANIEVDEKRLDDYLVKVYPDPAKPSGQEKIKDWERQVETARRDRDFCSLLYKNPMHLPVPAVRNTLWTAYNAVTEYVDHCSSRPVSSAIHLNSIWFGNRFAIKVGAFKVADQCAGEWMDGTNKSSLRI